LDWHIDCFHHQLALHSPQDWGPAVW
jgi:hypothetical protein